MGEGVTNKYIPELDPAKLARGEKVNKDKRSVTMFGLCCLSISATLVNHIYIVAKNLIVGNSGETYIVKILRLYVKCPTCASQITFKTDPATRTQMEKGNSLV